MKKKREIHERWMNYARFLTFSILGVIFTLNSFAIDSESSQQRITLNLTNAGVKDVFAEIRKQTDYNFVYNEEQMNTLKKTNITVQNASIREVLSILFDNTPYTYLIEGNSIVIVASNQVMTKPQNTISVSGKVIDEAEYPIPGVNVIIKNKNRGTSTTIDGLYKVDVEENDVLIFSFVGYKNIEIPVKEKKRLEIIKMELDVQALNEVQIVAYGEQNKREVTGAIETIRAEDLAELPTSDLANLLQGKAMGVSVLNMSGSPGGNGISVTIRGFNSLSLEDEGRRLSEPLWVIDGVPVDSYASEVTGTGAMADLDPNFIESIEILKDAASASIYGSRAANGVILVTTKKGKSGKAKFSINVSHSWSFNPISPKVTGGVAERNFRILQLKNYFSAIRYTDDNGLYQYRTPENYLDALANNANYDAFWNKGLGLDVPELQDSLNDFYNNSTNWFKEFLRVGKVINANIQASGGSETTNYSIGLGYYNEKGIMKSTDFKRMNLLGNFTMRPTKGLTIDNRLSFSYTDRARTSNVTSSLELLGEDPFKTSTLLPSIGSSVWDEIVKNMEGSVRKSYDYKFRNNFLLSYNILPNLKFSTSLGIDFWQNMADNFTASTLRSSGLSNVSQTIGRKLVLLNENLLTYKESWKDHRFDILLGQSNQYDQHDRMIGTASGGASDYIHYSVGFPDLIYTTNTDGSVSISAGQSFSSDHFKKTLASFFGRINYVFRDKYLLSFTLRSDGSSTFGKNNKWATFPSISLGWIFTDEYFFANSNLLTFGKIRASYGKSGLHFTQPYLALGIYETSSSETFLNQSTLHPVWDNGLYNSSLTWEETKQVDVGLDLRLFNDRLGITADYYYRYTDGLLSTVVLPGAGAYNAYSTQWRNAYAISNQGLEIKFDYDFFREKEFSWEFSLNLAKNWNRFEGSDDRYDMDYKQTNVNIVGKSLRQIYVYKYLGIYQSDDEVPTYNYVNTRHNYKLAGGNSDWYNIYRAGDAMYLDVNGDGKITTADKVGMGSPLPKVTGGFTNRLKYKDFDLNFLCTFLLGRTILDASLGNSLQFTIDGTTSIKALTPILTDLNDYDFWSKDNKTGNWPLIQAEGSGKNIYGQYTSQNIHKINYLKLKSFVLGYNLKKPFPGSEVNFRFFVSGENLWTITNYKGRDPETIDIVTGIDNHRSYPLSTRFTLGCTVNF